MTSRKKCDNSAFQVFYLIKMKRLWDKNAGGWRVTQEKESDKPEKSIARIGLLISKLWRQKQTTARKIERLTKIEAKQTREACVTIGKFCEFQNC